MLDPRTSEDFRGIIIDSLRKDILGPNRGGDWNPILDENLEIEGGGYPQRQYITGFLEPRSWDDEGGDFDLRESLSSDENITRDNEESEGGRSGGDDRRDPEPGVNGRTLENPSSMGISFVVNSSSLDVPMEVTAKWGQYEADEGGENWRRSQISHTLEYVPSDLMAAGDAREDLGGSGIYLETRAREIDGFGHFTVRLVNRRGCPDPTNPIEKGSSAIFQTRIEVSCSGIEDARTTSDRFSDLTTELLYHDSKTLARGHNVSVDWDDGGMIWTEWIPKFEVKRSVEDKSLRGHIPETSALSSPETLSTALGQLSGLITEYEKWAEDIRSWSDESGSSKLSEQLIERLEWHMSSVDENISRMKSGIDLLRVSKRAAEAFMYANDAILRSQECPAVNRPGFKWRPFQISFIILNLTGLLHGEKGGSEENRRVIDLAWFPTGGGKTEAYLGLVAIIGFYRHLCGTDQVASVQAVMRYTLRLLTLQQGERATRLVAAMNIVSRERGLGCSEFSVGMWVGNGTSPNNVDAAIRINQEVQTTNTPSDEGSPSLLERCPWCDETHEEPRDRAAQWGMENGRFRGRCSQDGCELNISPIPFSCIDEDIYQHPPTFLIGTVDKFARLASVPDSRVLIGLGAGGTHRQPPDLVIQDELHLLTGPLGSLHGLFEASIEVLWGRMGHVAKYVAATATIRGADRDTKLMYGRDLNVFPPPGLSIEDNFFSKYSNEVPGREHVAVLGNIANSRTILDMPLGNLLQVPYGLKRQFEDRVEEKDGRELHLVEPYTTTVVYFNSRRELAGAMSHLEDTVIPEWIPAYADRNGQIRRNDLNSEELYSRNKPEDLKKTLSNLKISSDDEGFLDACFTTNMFQVGVDVDRLGLMIINGQPKSNSEYIQASGRVGRDSDWPGLIVSTLRAGKPRDLSHYEMHRSFHQEMYRHVDITTTTPFSPRAMDRAINTILMLLFRQGIEACSGNDQIDNLATLDSENRARDLVDRLVEMISSRIEDERNRDVVEGRIRGSFSDLLMWIRRRQEDGLRIFWREPGRVRPGQSGWGQGFNPNPNAKRIMDSMRDVGGEVWFGQPNGRAYDKIPIGDLFSHARPGGLWDHNGWGKMTEGLNNWNMDQGQREGLEVREQVLSTLVAGYRIFMPPVDRQDGHMAVTDFPGRAVCMGNPAHIAYPIRGEEGMTCGHDGCDQMARPARFVSLCSAGHLEQFDWNYWIEHRDGCSMRNNRGTAHIEIRVGQGSRFNLGAFNVRCTSCGGERSLRGVTSSKRKPCNSYRPWINVNEAGGECIVHGDRERLSTRKRDSSSITLPDYGTVMLIHPQVNWHMSSNDTIRTMIKVGEKPYDDDLLQDVIDSGALEDTIYNLSIRGGNGYDKEGFMRDLNYQRQRIKDGYEVNRGNIRTIEFDGLAHGGRAKVDDGRHYLSYTEFGGEVVGEGVWEDPEWPISHLSRLERLTEIKYLTGIRRLDGAIAQDIGVFPNGERWGLGDYNYGEGVFIGLDAEWVEQRADIRMATLGEEAIMSGAEAVRRSSIGEELDIDNIHVAKSLPIVHTLSHLLIKELCWESGYSIGSIRERLYLKADDDGLERAGVLLYTTGQSSDGTLGGLASQGRREIIEAVMGRALNRLGECSNDPICSENRPDQENDSGASCHACVQLPETCCEIGNKVLDRVWE